LTWLVGHVYYGAQPIGLIVNLTDRRVRYIEEFGVEAMDDNIVNCWQFKKCGREPGGRNISKYGVCSVPLDIVADGINNGENGGRTCWTLREAACQKIMLACSVNEIRECIQCDFYDLIGKS
jgi:hypothetical protein